MSLRTPNPLTAYQMMLDLQRTKEQMALLQQQLASGSRLVRLEDDPTGSALVLDFQNSIDKNKAYVGQADSATSLLQASEAGMTSLNDGINRLLEIGQQGLSDVSGANGRMSMSREVDGIRTNIVTIANTQAEGKYIFAGTRTTTQPFSGPAAGPILYAGDNNSIDLDVSMSGTVSTNLPGDTVFFGGVAGQGTNADLFKAVTDLRDGLSTNNTALIQTAYDNLRTIHGRVNDQITVLGGRQATLNQLKDDTQNYNLSLQTIQSSYQSLDYPTAITDYTKAQTAQQAALSILAKANNQNLFNYLG